MSRTSFFAILLAAAVSACGQSVISAHSGTIHYTEGTVTLDGATVQPKFGQFPEVKPEQILATTEGRAEVLLTPGVFLRLGENSSFKMISNKLSDTRLEIQSGEAMLEVSELLQDNSIAILFKGAEVSLAKSGLYRFDANADPAMLKVYEGDAKVVAGGDSANVGKGHELAFGGARLEAKGFDTKSTDAFYRWSARRDEYVAEANISSAKTTRDSGYTGSGFGSGGFGGPGYSGISAFGMGQWAWNPWFGMYTYVPYNGMFFSPFGFGYFSPLDVGYLYGPYSPYLFGNGYYGGSGYGIAPGIGRRPPAVATSASSITRSGGLSSAASRGGSTGLFSNSGVNSPRGGLFGGNGISSSGGGGASANSVGMHGSVGASMGGGSVGGGHAGGVGSAGHK